MQKQLAAVFVWGLSSFALGTLIGFAAQRTSEVPELPDSKVDCCAMEQRKIDHSQIYFLDPHDERQANIPSKYKGAQWLLFVTEKKDQIFCFDTSLPGIDAEREEEALKRSQERRK